MRFTSLAIHRKEYLVQHLLKGVYTMKKLVIIVLAIFIVGYVALMVQYF